MENQNPQVNINVTTGPQPDANQYQAPPQPQYQAPPQPNFQAAPARILKTNRGLVKYILLSLITFGIYGLIVMNSVTEDLNQIASRYDGKKTTNYLLMSFILSPITLGIYGLIWFHKFSERMGSELKRRGITYSFGASDFWLWGILGSLIIVGPFIYFAKLFKSINLLADHYNRYG